MNILLINIDSRKIPNLALKKVERYYLDKGAIIEWDNVYFSNWADKIFVSCIFPENRDEAHQYSFWGAEIGGTGYDLSVVLPDEIESIRPRINLDFATRGCIRKCKFCFVPEKEGYIRAERDLYDIWDGESKDVVLLDNNVLALPEHFKLVCEQAQKEGVRLDFNQGLDIRLVTEETAFILSKTRMKEVRFALDDPRLISLFDEKLSILRSYLPMTKFNIYVLVGYNTTWEEDMERLLFLKSRYCRPYLMRYKSLNGNRKYIQLARWVNQRHLFAKLSFEQFLKKDGRTPDLLLWGN